MYVPQHFAETDNAVLHALIRAHPLGTWVTAGDDGLVANHIPFLIDPARGERGTLIAHVARANPDLADVLDGGAVARRVPGRAGVHHAVVVSEQAGPRQGSANVELRRRARTRDAARDRGSRMVAQASGGTGDGP